MNEMHEVDVTELSQIEGGTWMQFLDTWLGAMTGGFCGYGANGFEGAYHTAYKNPKGGNNNP